MEAQAKLEGSDMFFERFRYRSGEVVAVFRYRRPRWLYSTVPDLFDGGYLIFPFKRANLKRGTCEHLLRDGNESVFHESATTLEQVRLALAKWPRNVTGATATMHS